MSKLKGLVQLGSMDARFFLHLTITPRQKNASGGRAGAKLFRGGIFFSGGPGGLEVIAKIVGKTNQSM